MIRKLGLMAFAAMLMVPTATRVYAQSGDPSRDTTPAANSAAANEGEKDENEAYLHSASVKYLAKVMHVSTEAASTGFVVLNFAVLAIAIGAVLAKTLPKTFRDRTSGIQKQLTDARSATEEASVRLNSVEERLAKLDQQIADMKTQAEQDAIAEEKRFKAAAEEEKNKILATAEQEIASVTQAMQRQLQQYAAGLAIDQAAQRLVISAETDRLIVKNFAQRLAEGSKGGAN